MAIQNNQKVNKPLILSVSIFGALMITTLLSCALMTSNGSASAESASASVNVSAACTFESSTDAAHTATIDPGTWKEDIGQTSFTAKCNDPGGFAIYAVGYSNDEWKNTNLIGPNNNIIATNTNKNGNTSGWSMKLTNGTGDTTTILSPYNNYAIVPGGSAEDPSDQTGGYAKVATYNATTTGTSGSSLIATYGAYVADKQAAGMYNGEVKYTLVHPSGAEAPEAKDHSICETEICMQDLTGSSIAALLPNVNDVATVYDARDEQSYTIAKLADNKYWMVENLNLAGGTALSPDDTNVTSEYIANTDFSEANRLTKSDDGTKLILPASAIKNDADNDLTDETQFGTANYSYVFNSGNKENCDVLSQDTPCYSYYSWDAATLGSGRVIDVDNQSVDQSICPKGWELPSTYNGIDDITDFRALMVAYGGSSATQTYVKSTKPTGATMYSKIGPNSTVPNFRITGSYNKGLFSASSGYYWSSTSSSGTLAARFFGLNSSFVYSANLYNRGIGFSVRCLFAG